MYKWSPWQPGGGAGSAQLLWGLWEVVRRWTGRDRSQLPGGGPAAGTVAARGQASPTHRACLSRRSEPAHSADQFAKDPQTPGEEPVSHLHNGEDHPYIPAPQVGMILVGALEPRPFPLGVASTEVKSFHGEGWR